MRGVIRETVGNMKAEMASNLAKLATTPPQHAAGGHAHARGFFPQRSWIKETSGDKYDL